MNSARKSGSEFGKQANKDVMWAGASVLFVYIYFFIHFRSIVLATYCIILILFSFSLTQVLYKEVFQITFFNSLHYLVVFIVVGVAADNVFVIFDAWKQSRSIIEYDGNIRKRMAYSWKRSVKALLVTSSTTCVAFLSNAMSNIIPIKAFGLYAAIIIPVNFFIVITMLPPMLLFYDKYLSSRFCCIKFKSQRSKKYGTEQISNAYLESISQLIFGNCWNAVVRKLRWLIISLAIGWTVYAALQVKDIKPLTEQENFFPDDHPIRIQQTIIDDYFTTNE